jgi:hypothetical protein
MTDARPSPAAERMRRYRERRRRGLSCIKVQCGEVRWRLSSHADCWNLPSGRIAARYRQRSIDISMQTQLQDADGGRATTKG